MKNGWPSPSDVTPINSIYINLISSVVHIHIRDRVTVLLVKAWWVVLDFICPKLKKEMVIQRLEICIELVKLAIKFVFVVAEAVGIFIQQNMSPDLSTSFATAVPLPHVGFFP